MNDIQQIKYDRIIKKYISKLKIQNNSLTWVVYDGTKSINHKLFVLNKYNKELHIHSELLLEEFGMVDEDMVKIILKHFKLSKYLKEDDKADKIQ